MTLAQTIAEARVRTRNLREALLAGDLVAHRGAGLRAGAAVYFTLATPSRYCPRDVCPNKESAKRMSLTVACRGRRRAVTGECRR